MLVREARSSVAKRRSGDCLAGLGSARLRQLLACLLPATCGKAVCNLDAALAHNMLCAGYCLSPRPTSCWLPVQVVSTMATTSLEDVAAAGQSAPCLIFQLYVTKDRKFTASLIQSQACHDTTCACSAQCLARRQARPCHARLGILWCQHACRG